MDESIYLALSEVYLRIKTYHAPQYFWNLNFTIKSNSELCLVNSYLPGYLCGNKHIGYFEYPILKKQRSTFDPNQSNILSILHSSSQQGCELLNYLDLIKEDYLPLQHYKLVKFTCTTVGEALKRAVLIACLTYRGAQRDFIKVHTRQIISRAPTYISDIMRMQRAFLIEPVNYHPIPYHFQNQQPHQGFILPSQKMPQHRLYTRQRLKSMGKGNKLLLQITIPKQQKEESGEKYEGKIREINKSISKLHRELLFTKNFKMEDEDQYFRPIKTASSSQS